MNPILLRYAGLALAVAVGFGGGYSFKSVVDKKVAPRIENISAVYSIGNKIRVTGSGFSNPNTYRVKGTENIWPLMATNDGKELVYRLSISVKSGRTRNPAPWQDCGAGKTCDVPIQIINGDGIASDVFKFPFTIPDRSNLATLGFAADSPQVSNIQPGLNNVEILRASLKADTKNYDEVGVQKVFAFITPSKPVANCSDIGQITLYDESAGRVFGPKFLTGAGFLHGWEGVPDGSCVADFIVGENYLPVQDNPDSMLVSPGTEEILSMKLSVRPTAPTDISFKPGISLEAVNLDYTYKVLRSDNPITITK